jgi:hypothetical protein
MRRLAIGMTVLLWALSAAAADRSASIAGVVRNANGVPQMGAAVEVFASAARSVTVFTDAQGAYAATGLLPGFYTVRVTAPAFLPAVRERLSLRAGVAMLVNLTLSTIFDDLHTLPRTGAGDDDDWKWTLRSVASRPILRALDPQLVAEQRSEPLLTARLSFVAGSDAQGYGSSPDVSTRIWIEHPMAESTLGFGGNIGYAGSPSATVRAAYTRRLANGSTPQLSASFRRFAAPDPALRDAELGIASLTASDSFRLGDVVEVRFGSELQTVQFIRRVNAALPFGAVDVHLGPHTVLGYRYASSLPADPVTEDLNPYSGPVSDARPRLSIRNFRPGMERLGHQEVSVSRRMGKTNVMVAAYYDHLRDASLLGVGEVSGESGDLLPDAYSGTFTYQGPDLSTHGVRAVVQRKLPGDLTATFDYAFGGVLDLASTTGRLEDDSLRMRQAQRQAIGGRLSATMPGTKTHWSASYRWTSGRALTPVDMFNASPGRVDPYLNIVLRQPVPGFGFLPGHVEALVDIRNLLAEGYVPVMGSDGHTVYLVQAARSIRGGVAFTF